MASFEQQDSIEIEDDEGEDINTTAGIVGGESSMNKGEAIMSSSLATSSTSLISSSTLTHSERSQDNNSPAANSPAQPKSPLERKLAAALKQKWMKKKRDFWGRQHPRRRSHHLKKRIMKRDRMH